MAKRKNKNYKKKAKAKPQKAKEASKTQKSGIKKNYLEYAFITLLSGYIIADILPNFGYTDTLGKSTILNYGWLSLIGVSSLLLIWVNRKLISEKPASNKSDSDAFVLSYPKLAKIPLLGRITGYFYHQGMWVNLGLLGLLIVASIIYFYNLSYYNWLPDEPLVMKTARGYLESGTFYKWDYWTNSLTDEAYPRAWPHTWLVAQSINLFGSSEFTARMVSCLSGLMTIPILYFISHFILRNKLAALVVTACLIFHPYTVHYFRRVRMYAVLIPFFLLLFYYCYQAITSRKNHSNAFFNRLPGLKNYLNFNWGYILLALLLIYLNYEIHKISLVILPTYLLFYLYLLVSKREKRLVLVLVIALIPSLYLIIQEDVWEIFKKVAGNEREYNPLYWQFLFKYPITIGLSMVMILISVVWSILAKRRDPLIAALFLVLTGIMLYVFIIDFNDHYRYVIHLIPFCLILSIGMMIKLNGLISNRFLKSIIPVVIVLAAISEYNHQFESVYYNNIEAQFPKQAYPTIVKNINPESEAIIGLFFADYYLAGMGDQIELVVMDRRQMYTVNKFMADSRKHDAVWVTWATRKSYHINNEFYQYLAGNCVKYHGYGIDETLTEVFYCRK